MSNEREEFASRLAEAMRAAGYEPRPATLFRVFNARYRGRSVSFQSASRWLRGRSYPEQDKLQVLAELFGVEPQWLRYGGRRVSEPLTVWPAVGAREREIVDAFLALPAKQRELVGELIRALAKA
ncbi:helix-turn-helix domain-containing protein [Stenotrophomonas sp. MMGLT7]|uniref:helix-turn-helix domain-containing protein n=1 Tax=Stenotrophomonas sp. MMGLT7 TaxID=2901227 RepID=UPI001E2EF515|nr:helix-turn-helix domain-containing protein [Stenotrophomonas sp. MMGLT7]MCD7097643.1 helix-turn-helix domain-containing protein [Stenotrophomonas sp. MMGLT7]